MSYLELERTVSGVYIRCLNSLHVLDLRNCTFKKLTQFYSPKLVFSRKRYGGGLILQFTAVSALVFFRFVCRAVLFHIFDKETVGSNNSLGQVNIELKYLDLDEPIRKRYPLADLVTEIISLRPSHVENLKINFVFLEQFP